MSHEIYDATSFLNSKIRMSPDIGMITGTGLGNLTDRMEVDVRIPYKEIPHFSASTVAGHKGSLVSGRFAGRQVMAMEGRFHVYEGYTLQEITFPIRVMSSLGIEYLFISSAAGGLNPQFTPGDLMVITDHINLTGRNPLIGPNMDQFGPRFPDMSQVYANDLVTLAEKTALEKGLTLRRGVYVGITGPGLETPAETRFLRMIGSDAVGMSTVPEVIVGVHCGLKILGIVAITNLNLPDCMKETSIEEVIGMASSAGPRLTDLWEGVIAKLPA
ncbi:MAG: purine-nucleoside phosphorylase [Deltaproteobacteria bacterium]|nr:purine-nucleoside phosphorylase [Deltaproteobacteria bacterium]